MKKILYTLASKLLTAFGDIKVFKWPLWLVYDPDDYQVTGKQVLEIMELLQPGDILLRGYNRYLDGKLIPNMSGYSKHDSGKNIGKGFSHGAIYVGDSTIIHAVAEGVSKINVLDFLQCDRVAIFRPTKGQKTAIAKARKFAKDDVPYDFSFGLGANALYCFELCGLCYPKLRIETQTVSKLFGLIKKKDVYIAQSFIDSKDLELKYVHNPKYGIMEQVFS